MDTEPSLRITKLPHLNTVVMRQRGKNFFIATKDSIVIDIGGLTKIIEFLVMSGMLDHTELERILDEWKSDR